MNHSTIVMEYLQKALGQAQNAIIEHRMPALPNDIMGKANLIVERSEASKGVLAVVMTSLVYKILHPHQDIRRHQSSIPDGYSGRSFDTTYITPFLRQNRFPAMAESGWLTRSLEHKVPYDKEYSGAIKPKELKEAFLELINFIQFDTDANRESLLTLILAGLIQQRERNDFALATPRNLTIAQIQRLLEAHFSSSYSYEGASRLPVLALYAVYELLMQEVRRFDGKQLLPIENHTAADRRTGRLGDIDVVNEDGQPFEVVEVKFGVPISQSLIEVAYEKFMPTSATRYYILSTASVVEEEARSIQERIIDIKNTHGCQIIVNGIHTTLRYYLRLLSEPAEFVKTYTSLLTKDKTIKFEHRQRWNTLVEQIIRGEK